jgi:3-hydroxymyristoyl/3-hydroxydecanoyl-(acyl carrier protein) dehydratase
MTEAEFTIPPHHPALAGHFPDRPIVPGVVILDEVLALLARLEPPRRASGIVSAKFTAALAPGVACRVAFEPRADGSLRFACVAAGRPIASGILALFPL